MKSIPPRCSDQCVPVQCAYMHKCAANADDQCHIVNRGIERKSKSVCVDSDRVSGTNQTHFALFGESIPKYRKQRKNEQSNMQQIIIIIG